MTAPLDRAIRLRRAYEDPTGDDGYRVLVDRLWPRGRTKDVLRLNSWARDLGPSTELRKWFGHDPARWDEFRERYRLELDDPARSQALDDLVDHARKGPVTLVFAARDVEHNEARVIAEVLAERLTAPRGSGVPNADRDRRGY